MEESIIDWDFVEAEEKRLQSDPQKITTPIELVYAGNNFFQKIFYNAAYFDPESSMLQNKLLTMSEIIRYLYDIDHELEEKLYAEARDFMIKKREKNIQYLSIALITMNHPFVEIAFQAFIKLRNSYVLTGRLTYKELFE